MSMNAEGKSLKVNVLLNLVLQFSVMFLPLVTLPYVTRVLDPAGMGRSRYVLSIIAYFAMIAQIGIPTYGITACARVRDDLPKLRQTVKELMVLSLIMAVASYVLLAGVVIAVPKLRHDWWLYLAASSMIALQVMGTEWLFRALEQYSYLTTVSLSIRLAMVAATFLFVRSPQDVLAYVIIIVLTNVGFGLINIVRSRPFWLGEGTGGPLQLRQHLRSSLVFFWVTAAAAIYTNLDSVLLGSIRDDAELGLYATAALVKSALVMVVISVGAVLLPRVTYHAERGEMERFGELLKKAFAVVMLMAPPLAVFFSVFSLPTMMIFGEDYRRAAPMLIFLACSIVFIGMTNILGFQLLVPLRKEKVVALSVLCGAIVDVIANVVLVPRWGGVGTACATLIAEFAVLVYQLIAARAYTEGITREVPIVTLLMALVVATIASLPSLLWLQGFVAFVVGAALFFGAYAGMLALRREPILTSTLGGVVARVKARRP